MVSISMEDTMSIDTIYAQAVARLAEEKGLDLKELAHKVLGLSTPDISVRELRRVMRPDEKGRLRNLTLREAYELSRHLNETVETVIAYAMRDLTQKKE
jgi:hypothetical protein